MDENFSKKIGMMMINNISFRYLQIFHLTLSIFIFTYTVYDFKISEIKSLNKQKRKSIFTKLYFNYV